MADLSSYRNPPLMAIGDSLFQGVKSLTIKTPMMALSAPRQVAEALGIDEFSHPDPVEPILIDMERWLRLLTDQGLDGIKAEYRKSFDYWKASPASPSGRRAFENVSVAGATVKDLWEYTPRQAEAVIATELPKLSGDLLKDFSAFGGKAGDFVQALNTRFTLNPQGDPSLDDMSQFDWVRERVPERLLVNIGSNNGLYAMCFEADPKGRMAFGRNDADIRRFARELESLPDGVKHIYVNTLALPRSVADVMPIAPKEEPPKRDYIHEYVHPGPEGYFDVYENRFGFGYGRITGKQMKVLDDNVRSANERIRGTVLALPKNRQRVRFVNLTRLLLDYDIKHLGETAGRMIEVRVRRGLSDRLRLGAKMIDTSVGYRGGGLFSLDGMHLSTVGYGLMAQQIIETIEAKEGIDITDVDHQRNFERDTLLQDVPGIWNLGVWLYRDYRRATADAPESEDRDTVMAACAQQMRTTAAA